MGQPEERRVGARLAFRADREVFTWSAEYRSPSRRSGAPAAQTALTTYSA